MADYLTINGYGVDDYAMITSLSCTHGRSDITQQPSPGTFRASLQLTPGATFPTSVTLGSQVLWQIYDSTGYDDKRTIFFGFISDIQTSLQWSNGNGIYFYEITAVDNLATLSNKTTSSGFAKQYAGTRIAAILTAFGYDTSGITTPGDYELKVHSSGTLDNALELAQAASQSSMGVLYCQPNSNGRIKYQTYLDRKSNTEITLSIDDVLAGDYVLSTSTNTVVNQVTVSYGSGTLGTTYNDTTSQTTYGVRSGTRETTLHNSSDANAQAQILLASRKAASIGLRSLTVNTAVISDALNSSLAQVEVGTRIVIYDLPTPELQSFEGFIEGYTWTSARGQNIIQMTLSNADELYPYTLWNDLNGTDTWNTYALATTKWSDLT
jgi:hypothetical protein